MKYIIMCGGNYIHWSFPKQMLEINGEPIVARTIRLLRECGVNDIAISSDNLAFNKFGVPVLHHRNSWVNKNDKKESGTWVDAFYPADEPTCYIFGDVVFSKAAIKKIVETDTDIVEFFASAPPFPPEYNKEHAEPFAFKVVNTRFFRSCIEKVKILDAQKQFKRHPIAWELWQVIKNTPINRIDYTNYTVINDYTCDIDKPEDIENFRGII